MRKPNLTLFFEYLSDIQFGKDPFLVPYYLGKELDCSVTIVYPKTKENSNLPDNIKGVQLIGIPIGKSEKYRVKYRGMYVYLWKNAAKIDIMMKFFVDDFSTDMVILYRLRNPRGKVYIKMDVNPARIDTKIERGTSNIVPTIFKFFHIKRVFLSLRCRTFNYIFRKCVNVISCETSMAFDKLRLSVDPYNQWGNKLVMMPNGFDEELMGRLRINEKKYKEKENVMITVGRLGTLPKNTSMLIKALEKIDMKGWKFYFVGPIEDSYLSIIEDFYIHNPKKKESVFFTGAVYDKKMLWEYYNKSKVFVLTSSWESYGLVLIEAMRFRNYLLSTPVGAAPDLIKNGKYGELIEIDDVVTLSRTIQSIIDDKKKIDVYDDFDFNSLSWKNQVSIVANMLK